MNGVNVRRVWDAACSVGRVGQSGNRPPSADTAHPTVLKLAPFRTDPLDASRTIDSSSDWQAIVDRVEPCACASFTSC